MRRLVIAATATLVASPAIAADGVRFDMTINLTAIISIVAVVAGGIVVWTTVRNQVAKNKSDIADIQTKDMVAFDHRMTSQQEQIKQLNARVEQVRAKGAQELADFKLEVAREYATNSAIREVEERLVAAIDRLGDRLDRYFDSNANTPRRRGGSQ